MSAVTCLAYNCFADDSKLTGIMGAKTVALAQVVRTRRLWIHHPHRVHVRRKAIWSSLHTPVSWGSDKGCTVVTMGSRAILLLPWKPAGRYTIVPYSIAYYIFAVLRCTVYCCHYEARSTADAILNGTVFHCQHALLEKFGQSFSSVPYFERANIGNKLLWWGHLTRSCHHDCMSCYQF